LTADNGKESARHVAIAQALEAAFYFAHPYASWERGTNENANGLVRQYFPRDRDFSTITDEEIQTVMDKLNYCIFHETGLVFEIITGIPSKQPPVSPFPKGG
jgi:IS30 family transposase